MPMITFSLAFCMYRAQPLDSVHTYRGETAFIYSTALLQGLTHRGLAQGILKLTMENAQTFIFSGVCRNCAIAAVNGRV